MPETRIIKRYANRKLYDTEHSRYVTLDQISEMIRNGDDVKIVDNKTKEDLTTVTLAQIIFEEEKKQRSFLPLNAMRNIIQSGGEWFAEAQRRVQSILPGKRKEEGERDGKDGRDGRDGRDVRDGKDGARDAAADAAADATDEAMVKKRSLASLREWIDHSRSRLDEWQKQVDGKIRSTIDNISQSISPWASINKDVKSLADRIEELEAKLRLLEAHDQSPESAAAAGAGEPAAASAGSRE